MTLDRLKDVVPWGRPFDEYVSMFNLSSTDLNRTILDCGAGPSSFTAEANVRGGRVVACDPLYRFSAGEISARIDGTYPVMVAGMEPARDRFVWTWAGSPSRHAERRLEAMRRFLADFPVGSRAGRYVTGALPALPFADNSFDLTLTSHFLFLYSEHLSLQFHLAAIDEMLRIASQVRIFPLLDLAGERSAHLQPIMTESKRRSFEPRIVTVPYKFQRGGNQYLQIDRP